MDHISLLLPRVLRKRGLKDEADASLIVHVANGWLKERVTGARATKLERNVLFLETSSSIAAQETHGLSEELLSALHERFPAISIEKVRLLRG